MTTLARFLDEESSPLAPLLSAIASTSVSVMRALPSSGGLTRGVNPSGEQQTEIDVFANRLFVEALLSTGRVAEVASEEMEKPASGTGQVHVAMDPLDGSSNIATNNPLGSIFGFYSSDLPCSGRHLTGAAFVTYGPMLTLTFSTGGPVHRFVAATGEGGLEFVHSGRDLRIPEKGEVYGMGGQRRDWVEPVDKFVASLEERGLKLRYGGTFVGDYNQVLHYGGIFGYPSLRAKPKGKLRVLYEAAPMSFITIRAHGKATDGLRPVLEVEPTTLAEATPLYLGSKSLVEELERFLAVV